MISIKQVFLLALSVICFANAQGQVHKLADTSQNQHKSPNIVLIIADQFRADACKREGFALNTTPFLDSLAETGIWFNRAYCASPACVPSRTSLIVNRQQKVD